MTDRFTVLNRRKPLLSPQVAKLKDCKVIQDGDKTYVIIVKDHKVSSGHTPVNSAVNIDAGKFSTKDRVKRSLVNLGDETEDDFYTPASELEEVFGDEQSSENVDDKQQSVCDLTGKVQLGQTRMIGLKSPEVKRLCRSQSKTNSRVGGLDERLIYTKSNKVIVKQSDSFDKKCIKIKRETVSPNPSILSRKLFASPIAGSSECNQFTKFTQKTPDCSNQLNTNSPLIFHKYAYQTPTPELPTAKTAAVRQIFIVQSPQYRKSSTPKRKPAVNSPKVVLRDSNSPAQPSSTTHILFSPNLSLCSASPKPSPSAGSGLVLTQSPYVQLENCKGPSLNDSLTNIQWLGGLASDELTGPKTNSNSGVPSGQEIDQVNLECGRLKRPAFSYMMLIRMSLETRPDKRLTLREICKWIEETFPFYKYSAKPGWKNSIRHNLSVYDMFVRVPSKPKQHGAQWTVRETNIKKTKYSKPGQNKGAGASNQCIIAAVNSITSLSGVFTQPTEAFVKQEPDSNDGSNKTKKKGPTPILPRPTMPLPVFRNSPVMPPGGNLQTYALIPITSLGGAIPGSTSLSMGATVPVPLAPNPVSHSSSESVGGMVNTFISENRPGYTCDVIKEAWQAASAMETNEIHVSEQTVKRGLPKPKMYANKSKRVSKKTVRKRKGGGDLLSPVRCDVLVNENQLDSDLENGLPTPLRQLLDTPVCDNLSTSTPNKPLLESPRWLSPISTLTPNKHDGVADGSFLDFLPSSLDLNSPTIITPVKSLEAWMKIASGLLDTPNAALMSPQGEAGVKEAQKHTETINHLLAEIDPCLVDELDNCHFNLSTLNWPGTDISIVEST